MTIEDWHAKLYDVGEEDLQRDAMQPFSLKGTTAAQEQAIRDLAAQAGFKDLRGFHNWMRAADITYYDIIKVASP